MSCLIATKCGKTQMNYVLRVNNANIFHSILKEVQTSKRPSRELKNEAVRQNGYLGTIAKLSIKAPCMDQVILNGWEKTL